MNALTTAQPSNQVALLQQAEVFAISPLVPGHLRHGGEAVARANCFIALHLAQAMGENPIVVMQNIHIVNGKAGFSAQYMIARANASGVFDGRINWRVSGAGKGLAVTAYAVLKDTGEEVSATVSMEMAEAEGWTKNPKYKTMPEVMLRYRAATFLVRWYCPEVMLGYHTIDEVEDVGAAGAPERPARRKVSLAALAEAQQAEVIDAQPEPEAAPEKPAPDSKALTRAIEAINGVETIIDLQAKFAQISAFREWSDEEYSQIDAAYQAKEKQLKGDK